MFIKIQYYCYLAMMIGAISSCGSPEDAVPKNELLVVKSDANGEVRDTLTGSNARTAASVGREDVIKGLNQWRRNANLPLLKMDERLNETALIFALRGSRSIDSDYKELTTRALSRGYRFATISAVKYRTNPSTIPITNSAVFTAWAINTPGFANVFNSRDIGVASAIVGGFEYYVFVGGTLKPGAR